MTTTLPTHPTPPGSLVRGSFMEPLGLTMTDLAKALDVSVSSVSRVVNEKAEVTTDMALRLSYVFGGSPKTWLRLQLQHDLSKAQQRFDSTGLRKLVPDFSDDDDDGEQADA